MKKKILTTKAPAPVGPYSQGITVGKRIYVSGQGALNPDTGKTPESVSEQTKQVLNNIKTILEEAGATMDDVVKVTAHLQDLKDFDEFNKEYCKFFRKPYPVRTTVGSQLLNTLVEIDVIAELDE